MKRVCVKILSTWEGLKACRVLEKEDIYTFATTLVTIGQATLADEVGCRYITPYVNELKAQIELGYMTLSDPLDSTWGALNDAQGLSILRRFGNYATTLRSTTSVTPYQPRSCRPA